MQSTTPIFSNIESYEYKDLLKLVSISNITTKFETKTMIRKSKVTNYIPISFDSNYTKNSNEVLRICEA